MKITKTELTLQDVEQWLRDNGFVSSFVEENCLMRKIGKELEIATLDYCDDVDNRSVEFTHFFVGLYSANGNTDKYYHYEWKIEEWYDEEFEETRSKLIFGQGLFEVMGATDTRCVD